MRQFIALLAMMLIMSPLQALAAGPDIGIYAKGIRFSESTLVAGANIRLYATLKNEGDSDISGYVTFYQGDIEISSSQVVTLVKSGEDEQVWVDFTVPFSAFNIRGEVRGTDPQDVNSSNDTALTALFYPIIDEDGDGIADDTDNCPNDANTNQLDTDEDGIGDACDTDDDGDTLTDSVEADLGTSPTNVDTDGDGVNDASDAYPLDASRSVKEKPAPAPAPSTTPTSTTTITTSSNSTEEAPPAAVATIAANSADGQTAAKPVDDPSTPEDESAVTEATIEDAAGVLSPLTTDGNFEISPNAAFKYRRLGWKTYEFETVALNSSTSNVNWDFGDGVTSAERNVTHTFKKPGDYTVKLAVIGDDGVAKEDEQVIEISAFHLGNPLLDVGLGLLSLLFIASLILAIKHPKVRARVDAVRRLRLGGNEAEADSTVDSDETTEEDVVEEDVKEESEEEVEEVEEKEEEPEVEEDLELETEPEPEEEVPVKKTTTHSKKKA